MITLYSPYTSHFQAITKIRDFLLQKVYLLKRPKTNLQIIQQSSLLKYKYFIQFLRQHGPDLFIEVRVGSTNHMQAVQAVHKYEAPGPLLAPMTPPPKRPMQLPPLKTY